MRRIHTMRQRFFFKSFFQNLLLLLAPILLIGPFSIWELNMESRSALKKSSYNVLYQVDETMNTLLSELDNVYYYIRSNPSITTSLKAAYSEPEITLNSLRSINNISSLLRYYMYTSEYIQSIYVYYYNDRDRLLVPEKGMVSLQAHSANGWIESSREMEEDIWLATAEVAPDKYSEAKPVIYYCRKLYSTIDPSNAIGVIAVQYDADALIRYINSLGLYSEQSITVLNKKNQILFQNMPVDALEFLDSETELQLGGFEYSDIRMDKEKYTVSQMHSNYVKDLDYVSVVPTKNILRSSSWFATVFCILVGGAIVISMILAVFKTQKDYKRLEEILDLLSHPELATSDRQEKTGAFLDPYNYITYNILHLFLQQNYLKVQTSEQKYRLKTMELMALQQQINPHFLHNTLNTIYWEAIALTKGPNTCADMLTKLAAIMRYSLGNPDESVTVREELGYLKNYVFIQARRYQNKFQVEYDIDEKALDYPIRKILLQPLVENAINHGIKELEREGIIRMKVHDCGTHIYISVLDTGVGMDRETLLKLRQSLLATEEYSPHIGLLNSHRRLVLTYGPDAGIHIQSHKNRGTCIFFRLPLEDVR